MSIIEKALEKQRELHGETAPQPVPGESVADQLAAQPADEAQARREGEPARDPLTRGSRHVQLDLVRLERFGVLTPNKATSATAEELRLIKRPLLVNAFGDGGVMVERGNLIMVTSALPGEGKTFTSANLAMSMAMELDRTVLLVDADVAKPSVTRLFGIQAEKGLVDVLVDPSLQLPDVLLRTDVPKLTLLPAGSRVHHSTEILASDAMRRLAQELSQRYADRVVIFDTPPLLAASQASVLARLMGQIVLVVEADRTPQHIVQDALSHLDSTEVVGLVLNKTSQRRATDYYGYYGYGSYGSYGTSA